MLSIGDVSICGTRGWMVDVAGPENTKILNRELLRLQASLEQAQTDNLLVFLHYPPPVHGKPGNPFYTTLEKIRR